MTNLFHYSILKYVHSSVTEEELNLGILFFFPAENKLLFKSVDGLIKFKNFYPDFKDQHIAKYFSAFENKAFQLSYELQGENFKQLIETHFLTRDETSLRFGEIKTTLLFNTDISLVATEVFRLYFPQEVPLVKKTHISEIQIIQNFKSKLKIRDEKLIDFIREPQVFKTEKSFFKPDLIFQHQTSNAVKATSFDVADENKIIDKALLLNNKLNYLIGSKEIEAVRFDLLVCKPTDPLLFSTYQNALDILHDIKVDKKIVESADLDAYIDATLEEVEG